MIAYLLSWGLFWMGDLVSKIMNNHLAIVLYPVYNWLMTKSYDVQDKYKVEKGPWNEPNTGD